MFKIYDRIRLNREYYENRFYQRVWLYIRLWPIKYPNQLQKKRGKIYKITITEQSIYHFFNIRFNPVSLQYGKLFISYTQVLYSLIKLLTFFFNIWPARNFVRHNVAQDKRSWQTSVQTSCYHQQSFLCINHPGKLISKSSFVSEKSKLQFCYQQSRRLKKYMLKSYTYHPA